MLTLESFEEAAEIVKTGNPGDQAGDRASYFSELRLETRSIFKAREHAENRCI